MLLQVPKSIHANAFQHTDRRLAQKSDAAAHAEAAVVAASGSSPPSAAAACLHTAVPFGNTLQAVASARPAAASELAAELEAVARPAAKLEAVARPAAELEDAAALAVVLPAELALQSRLSESSPAMFPAVVASPKSVRFVRSFLLPPINPIYKLFISLSSTQHFIPWAAWHSYPSDCSLCPVGRRVHVRLSDIRTCGSVADIRHPLHNILVDAILQPLQPC